MSLPSTTNSEESNWPFRVLILSVAVILGGLPFGLEPVGGDPDMMYRPFKEELSTALRHGRLPFWSDHLGVGVPLLADSHVAALYPPNLIYGVLPVGLAYRLLMWLSSIATAGATFAYARRIGVGPWGAALAGLSFSLCGFQANHAVHEWSFSTQPFLPAALIAADRFCRNGGRVWLVALAFVLGIQLTIGHFFVQWVTIGLVVLTSCWIWIKGASSGRRVLGIFLAIFWGSAIAALPLSATRELVQFTRFERNANELSMFALKPEQWAQAALPRLFSGFRDGIRDEFWMNDRTSGVEAVFQVGTVPLIFAFIGLFGRTKNALLPFWTALIPVSFLLACLPILAPNFFETLTRFPGFGMFRCPARYTLVTSFAIAILAGYGFDRLIDSKRFVFGIVGAALFGALAAGWSMVWSNRPEVAERLKPDALTIAYVTAMIAWLLSIATILAWKRRKLGSWGPFALTFIELGLLFYNAPTYWAWNAPEPSESPAFQALKRESGVRLVAGRFFDLPTRVGLTSAYPYLGIKPPSPNEFLLESSDPERFLDPALAQLYRRLGVTHGVWEANEPQPVGKLVWQGSDPVLDRVVARQRGPRPWKIVSYPDVFPEARAVVREGVVPDRASIIASLISSNDPEIAWFVAEPRHKSVALGKSAKVVSWDGTTAVVEHDGPCHLIVTRTYYPGWLAQIDQGPEGPVDNEDFGLQSVRIDGSGTSRVRFRYQPRYFVAGTIVSLTAMLTAVLVLSLGRRGEVLPSAAGVPLRTKFPAILPRKPRLPSQS